MDDRQLSLWQAKLAAWLHDPAEKALILMRTPDGHEAGTVARLRELCFGSERLPADLDQVCRVADHWAAAADRPQWPRPKDDKLLGRDIRFWDRSKAVLVHPLAGDQYNLGDLYIDKAGRIEAASSQHYEEVLRGIDLGDEFGKDETATADLVQRALLTLWRLAPARAPEGLDLDEVWRLLPADSRVPDHSIWEHLSLASAFAGAVSGDADGNPALLLVSLGPVQGFIEQGRSVSDLWAGSHLLSMMAWQAMKVVAERFGPDAVVFPSLWSVPLVDAWLEREMGVELPADLDWKRRGSDANPLFAACLPNRFVALVPAGAAEGLAHEIEARVRDWVKDQTGAVASRLLAEAGISRDNAPLWEQITTQLAGFPEVYWAAVPFAPLIEWDRRPGWYSKVTSVAKLRSAVETFYGDVSAGEPGFLGHKVWELLSTFVGKDKAGLDLNTKDADAAIFFTPNPGVLYPAISDLVERCHAAAKAGRTFVQVRQEGYRCDLCGEWEWLRGPGDEDKHREPGGKKRGETLWTRIAARKPSWVRKGEHLCALCALKRLWPTIFVDWVKANIPEFGDRDISRFVISTHTLALAPDLAQLSRPAQQENESHDSFQRRQKAWGVLLASAKQAEHRVPLPKKLADALSRGGDRELEELAHRLPARLDELGEPMHAGAGESADVARRDLESIVSSLKTLLGHKPEAYYGLILMDGDGMGRWMSGDTQVMLRYRDAWHPGLVDGLSTRFTNWSEIHSYFDAQRAASPSHHVAVSSALNGFSLHVARWVVEELFLGRLIYAGGDDVLAMVAVDDLLPCMLTLRCAYSGVVPAGEKDAVWELYRGIKERLTWIEKGYVLLGGKGGKNAKLLRMMGGRATASAGAVVAHHTAPLQGVLRVLRAAEKRAKTYGRNAFSIALMKRAGGLTHYTASWGFGGSQDESVANPRDVPYAPARWAAATANLRTPMGLLFQLRDTLADPYVSRRAAYNIVTWLPDLPEFPGKDLHEKDLQAMLTTSIAWQLGRQGVKPPEAASALADGLVASAFNQCRPRRPSETWRPVTAHLKEMLLVGEFLAREGRARPAREGRQGPGQMPETVAGGDA